MNNGGRRRRRGTRIFYRKNAPMFIGAVKV